MTGFYRKLQSIIVVVQIVSLVGCSTPARRGTAMDQIKSDLQTAIVTNATLEPPRRLPRPVTEVLKKKSSTADLSKIFASPEPRFDIVANDEDAQTFFLGLVEDTDVNLMVHPKVSGKISLKLKAVTISEALDMVRRLYGYGFEVDGYNVRVLPAELQTKTFKVNYLDMVRGGSSNTQVSSSGVDAGSSGGSATTDSGTTSSTTGASSSSSSMNSSIQTNMVGANVWDKLKDAIEAMIGTEGGRKVAVSPMTGMVVVQAMPLELIKIEKFLQDSETFLNRQVILEAKVLEVELNDAYRAGINWGILSKHINASQLGGALHSSQVIDVVPPISAGSVSTTGNPSVIDLATDHVAPAIAGVAQPFGGVLTLGLNYASLAAFVELLSSQGNVQTLSNPRISTSNNQKAIIKVGTDDFFITNVVNTTTTGTSTTNAPTFEFEAFFSGIALDVTPQINGDGFITLHIHPTVSTVIEKTKRITLAGALQEFPLASSTIRESDSIVRARDGQFVVIGGLMQDKTAEIVTGVPFFKDIPFLGTAFRQTRQQANKTELVILLRPMIVSDGIWGREIAKNYDRFDKLDSGFHVGGGDNLYGNLAETKCY